MTEPTYDKAQVDELVAAAVAEAVRTATDPLKERIAELEAGRDEGALLEAIAAVVTEATTPLQEQVTELQSKLDTSEAEKAAAVQKLADVTAYLEAEVEKTELEEKKTARRAEAEEIAPFDEKYLDEEAERFAAMSDEDWGKLTASWKLVAEKSGTPPPKKDPTADAMHGSRQSGGGGGGEGAGGAGSTALGLIGDTFRTSRGMAPASQSSES